MSVGFPQNKLDVDSRAGQLALTLRDTLRDVRNFKVFLDSKTDTELTALAYSAAEVTLIRAAYVDLDKLAQISSAAATQPAASDFFFNAKKLLGVL